MELTLRKIKHLPSLSEETEAYTATVYLDGRAVCNVNNHGHGGPDNDFWLDPLSDDDKNIMEYLAANPSGDWLSHNWQGTVPTYDLEAWCGEQLNRWINEKIVRRRFNSAMKSAVLFTRPVTKGVFQVRFKGVKAPFNDKQIALVKSRNHDAIILQEMTKDKAFEVFSQNITGV